MKERLLKERPFKGMLNSKAVYGQSYSDYEVLRTFKYNNILKLQKHNPLFGKWYKRSKMFYPSWGKSLWNDGCVVNFTPRQENTYSKNKKIDFMRWR